MVAKRKEINQRLTEIECRTCGWIGNENELIAPYSGIEPGCPSCLGTNFLDKEMTIDWQRYESIKHILFSRDTDGILNDTLDFEDVTYLIEVIEKLKKFYGRLFMGDGMKPGWLWLKGEQRPFLLYREITKGRNKGMFEFLISDKKVVAKKEDVKRWPEEGENDYCLHRL